MLTLILKSILQCSIQKAAGSVGVVRRLQSLQELLQFICVALVPTAYKSGPCEYKHKGGTLSLSCSYLQSQRLEFVLEINCLLVKDFRSRAGGKRDKRYCYVSVCVDRQSKKFCPRSRRS